MAYRKTKQVREQLAGKRLRIYTAARQLVTEGGFHEAPVAAIAALAGVATGTVYRYFPSKAQLFAEVVDRTSQRELDIIVSIVESGGPPHLRLADAIRAFASRALRGRRLAFALVAEPVEPEIDAVRLKYRRALGEVFERIVRQGIKSGAFVRQDAAVTAACLVGACFEGLVGPLSPESGTSETERSALVEAIIGLALRAAGAVDSKK